MKNRVNQFFTQTESKSDRQFEQAEGRMSPFSSLAVLVVVPNMINMVELYRLIKPVQVFCRSFCPKLFRTTILANHIQVNIP